MTCPICKNVATFTDYRPIRNTSGDPTEVPNTGGAKGLAIGALRDPSGEVHTLLPGRNVIGRRSPASTADIQLAPDRRRLSREHLVIEVQRIEGRGFVHTVSLFKEKVNPTAVGDTTLYYGDKVILRHGDIIRLPELDLVFEIPDPDITL